jgi:hypothetical protein
MPGQVEPKQVSQAALAPATAADDCRSRALRGRSGRRFAADRSYATLKLDEALAGVKLFVRELINTKRAHE